jgi:hypothetical protein
VTWLSESLSPIGGQQQQQQQQQQQREEHRRFVSTTVLARVEERLLKFLETKCSSFPAEAYTVHIEDPGGLDAAAAAAAADAAVAQAAVVRAAPCATPTPAPAPAPAPILASSTLLDGPLSLRGLLTMAEIWTSSRSSSGAGSSSSSSSSSSGAGSSSSSSSSSSESSIGGGTQNSTLNNPLLSAAPTAAELRALAAMMQSNGTAALSVDRTALKLLPRRVGAGAGAGTGAGAGAKATHAHLSPATASACVTDSQGQGILGSAIQSLRNLSLFGSSSSNSSLNRESESEPAAYELATLALRTSGKLNS